MNNVQPFAESLVEYARMCLLGSIELENIEPIKTTDYRTPAQQSKDSMLTTKKLQRYYNLRLLRWDRTLNLCMKELDIRS